MPHDNMLASCVLCSMCDACKIVQHVNMESRLELCGWHRILPGSESYMAGLVTILLGGGNCLISSYESRPEQCGYVSYDRAWCRPV